MMMRTVVVSAACAAGLLMLHPTPSSAQSPPERSAPAEVAPKEDGASHLSDPRSGQAGQSTPDQKVPDPPEGYVTSPPADEPPPNDEPYVTPTPSAPQAGSSTYPSIDPAITGAKPYRVRYREGMPVPPGAEIEYRRRPALWIPGLAAFAAAYISSILVWTILTDDELTVDGPDNPHELFAPVVGPAILAARGNDLVPEDRVALVFATLVQGVGLSLFVAGMRKRPYLRYWVDPHHRGIALVPSASRNDVGATLSARW